MPEDEINRLVAHFNDALAESAEFVAQTRRQKQVMHEHAVISGSNIWSHPQLRASCKRSVTKGILERQTLQPRHSERERLPPKR